MSFNVISSVFDFKVDHEGIYLIILWPKELFRLKWKLYKLCPYTKLEIRRIVYNGLLNKKQFGFEKGPFTGHAIVQFSDQIHDKIQNI